MNIYLLGVKPGVHPYTIYDAYDGHVIAANSGDEAREMAPIGDEGNIWTDKRKTHIKVVGTYNRKRKAVILSSFNAS